MKNYSVKNVIWEHSEDFAGRIAVSLEDGRVSFLSGPPELERAIQESLSQGVFRLSSEKYEDGTIGTVDKLVHFRDPCFDICLSGVLGLSGFQLEL